MYEEYQDEAEAELKREFGKILEEGERDVVLDFSFYNREYRDDWRGIVEEKGNGEGVRVILVYFDATEEVLWERVQVRSGGKKDADNAAEITRELLGAYASGFEKPEVGGEEAEVVVVKVA
jgi:predicted kinase